MYGRGPQIGFGPPVFPDVVKAIIAANCAVYLVQALGPPAFTAWFALTPEAVWEHGAIWQLATYMWLHAESPLHLLFNMFSLWMFGSQVAAVWGTQRFLRFYLICGVGAGALIAAWPALLHVLGFSSAYGAMTLGASGAIYGVLLAFSLLWPDRTIMLLFPPIPLKSIWFIPFLFFMEVVTDRAGNVSHIGHLGGVLVGYIALRMMGLGGRASFGQLRWRLKRWRMRRQLRAVPTDEPRERERDHDHRTYH